MRYALAGLVLALLAAGKAESFAQEPASDLWTMTAEGNRHEASGANCLEDIPGFAPLAFMAGDGGNFLGLCSYIDATGTGNAGLRVRRYVAGQGESQEAIENDRALMEPSPGGSPPLFAVRMGRVALGDGKDGGRVTVTKVRNGFLVDCFAEGATLNDASAKIALVCAN